MLKTILIQTFNFIVFTKRLIILQGVPGSGKSTFAKLITTRFGGVSSEADEWFEKYNHGKFDPTLLGKAHQWCKDEVREALKHHNLVVVANTNTQNREVEPYLEMANERVDCDFCVLRLMNRFKSIHNVPEETINRMEERLKNYNLTSYVEVTVPEHSYA